jgi:HD-like signal output (HDOD) protein
MVTKEEILAYIEKIPPAPNVVQKTVKLLQAGELPKAAKVAQEDLALSAYLRSIVNKPIYGFKNEVKDIAQIFSILGVSRSQQAVYNYLLGLLSPKEWKFFQLTQKSFYSLQDQLSVHWSKILEHLHVKDAQIEASITLLPSSIIVAEAIFASKEENVKLIRTTKDIDLNTMLQRLSGYTLFDISELIAQKWEMDEKIATIVKLASGNVVPNEKSELVEYAKWMHLLMFYIFSKPNCIEAGLNDFIEFNVEFVSDIYEDFMQVVEIEA